MQMTRNWPNASKTEESFENWTMLRWQNCQQS